jgi:Flp pilus assembly pilin Flp
MWTLIALALSASSLPDSESSARPAATLYTRGGDGCGWRCVIALAGLLSFANCPYWIGPRSAWRLSPVSVIQQQRCLLTRVDMRMNRLASVRFQFRISFEETSMLNLTKRLWQDEQGQDLIEYTLLMAFVALASAALFISSGTSISSIWSDSNSELSAAATTASS